MTARIVRARRSSARESQGRRGVTLLEMIVVMTGVAAMLGLTVLMLQLLLKLDGDSRARLDSAGMLARLAEHFRRDVHGAGVARLVEQPPGPAGLRIEAGPDRAIEYKVKGQSRVIRVESIKGKVVRSESYEIARGGPIELALKQEGGRRFATLTVDRQASRKRTDPPRLFDIVALVGRNRDRLAAAAPAAGGTP